MLSLYHNLKNNANFEAIQKQATSVIISPYMPQRTGLPHKKSNQGYASGKYDPEKKRAAQSRGGKAKVPKGFATMSPERRREVARKGGLA